MRKKFRYPQKIVGAASVRQLHPFFESWYYKHATVCPAGPNKVKGVKTRNGRVLSIAPFSVRAPSGLVHFVQVIDGVSGCVRRYNIPKDAVSYRRFPFELKMADSVFRLDGMDVNLKDSSSSLRASLRFGKLKPPSRGSLSKWLIDPTAFVPILHHQFGIASLDHSVSGYAELTEGARGECIDFADGRGYLEKEWGAKLPSSWLRIQTNAFDPALGACSLSFSLARIKRWGIPMKGFICFLLAGDKEYRFNSLNGAKIDLLERGRDSLRVLFSDKRYKVELLARELFPGSNPRPLCSQAGTSPQVLLGDSVDARVRVVLKRRNGPTEDVVFDATGQVVGTAVIGDLVDLR